MSQHGCDITVAGAGVKPGPRGSPGPGPDGSVAYALRTFAAWSPLGPLVTSNSTRSPSARLLKP